MRKQHRRILAAVVGRQHGEHACLPGAVAFPGLAVVLGVVAALYRVERD